MNIEDVDKTMDEISDAQDQMQQMNDVLAQPIGGAADLDDDELAAELAVSLMYFFVIAKLQASSVAFLVKCQAKQLSENCKGVCSILVRL